MITGSPNLVRNAPENLLLSAKRLRYLRACPCECRPAPQKEVLGRSICYPSTRRCAWTNRRRDSGYLLFLVPPCSWGEGGAGRHEQPEGNGATRADTTKMHRRSTVPLSGRACPATGGALERTSLRRTERSWAHLFCLCAFIFPSSSTQNPIRCIT